MSLHENAIVIDGLVISDWGEQVFTDMQAGGITAANCTCSVWENFRDSMHNIAVWKGWFQEFSHLIRQVHCVKDIHAAKAEGRTGIILGWQNTSGIEDRVSDLVLFRDLGVRAMQLTYNTQNFVGSGCFEHRDGGLSDFGHDVVAEMNKLGILIDLSHVGPETSADTIRASRKPVAYTHCCPSGLLQHPRNKSNEQIRSIVNAGGFVGTAIYPPFLPTGAETTLDDGVAAIEYMINVAGEENVGIGTDFTQGRDADWFDWLRRDKGVGRWLMSGRGTTAPFPKGFERLSQYPSLTATMEKRGWSETRIERILGQNWLRVLEDVWGDT